nr:hypothetical protein [Deinococcus yavapaiensis]
MAWHVALDRGLLVARVTTDFGGVLPDLRRVQTSKMHPQRLVSLGYAEGDGKRATFESLPDDKTALLTVRQGRDEASAPLVTDLHDPISLLWWLRSLQDEDRAEVRMVGGRAIVRRLANDTVNGVAAVVYEIRPGGALVHVEDAPERRLLRLVQPTDFGPIDATLREDRPRRTPEPRQEKRGEPSRRRRR